MKPITGVFSVAAQVMPRAPHTLSFWAKLDPKGVAQHVLLGRAMLWILKPGENEPTGEGMLGDPSLMRVPYASCQRFFDAATP
jgi:hypothetical protein